jgi:hypothetical protein
MSRRVNEEEEEESPSRKYHLNENKENRPVNTGFDKEKDCSGSAERKACTWISLSPN